MQTYKTDYPIGRDADSAAVVGTPFPFDDDAEQWLQWLMAESFAHQAESEFYELVGYEDMGEVPWSEIRPEVELDLGRPRRDFIWRHFEGTAKRPAWFAWCEAEAHWRDEQDALAEAERDEGLPYA